MLNFYFDFLIEGGYFSLLYASVSVKREREISFENSGFCIFPLRSVIFIKSCSFFRTKRPRRSETL